MKPIWFAFLVGVFLVGINEINLPPCFAQEKGKLGRLKEPYEDKDKEKDKDKDKDKNKDKKNHQESDTEDSSQNSGFFANLFSGMFRGFFESLSSRPRSEVIIRTFVTDSTGQMVPRNLTESDRVSSFSLYPYEQEEYYGWSGENIKTAYMPIEFRYHLLGETVKAYDFKLEYMHRARAGFNFQGTILNEILKDGTKETLNILQLQWMFELWRSGNFGVKAGLGVTGFNAPDLSSGGGGLAASLFYFPASPVVISVSLARSWMGEKGIPYTDLDTTVGLIVNRFEFLSGLRSLIAPGFHLTGPTLGLRIWI